MSRIKQKFKQLKSDGRKGFIPFITVGDPDIETSLAIIVKLAELGADVIEIGVPFSDPMADGPTIQRSSQRALENGTTLTEVLRLAAEVRKQSPVPLVLFSYFNPILRFGINEFSKAASDSGIDGVLLTDVIEDEAAAISKVLASDKIDLISLISPTTTDDRLEAICRNSHGFIYAVSRSGVTGAQLKTSYEAENLVSRARQFTDLPIAVGFGISTRNHIADVWRYADAAVVGSAIVNVIETADNTANIVADVEQFVTRLLPQFAKGDVEN